MIRTLLYMICFLLSVSGSVGQSVKRVVKSLDTLDVSNALLEDGAFLKSESSVKAMMKEEFDLVNVDQDLINAGLFYSINELRRKKSRRQLVFSEELYRVAAAYIYTHGKYLFEETKGNTDKLNKPLTRASSVLNYHKRILSAFVFRVDLLDFDARRSFYHDSSIEGELALFEGEKPSRKEVEEGKAPEPVPLKRYSYAKLSSYMATKRLYRSFPNLFSSKSYSEMACFLLVDERTLFKKVIPQANVIVVMAGQSTEKLNRVRPPKELVKPVE